MSAGYGPGLLQDGDVMALARLTSLTHLDLSDQADVTDVGFAALAALPQLQVHIISLLVSCLSQCILSLLPVVFSLSKSNRWHDLQPSYGGGGETSPAVHTCSSQVLYSCAFILGIAQSFNLSC